MLRLVLIFRFQLSMLALAAGLGVCPAAAEDRPFTGPANGRGAYASDPRAAQAPRGRLIRDPLERVSIFKDFSVKNFFDGEVVDVTEEAPAKQPRNAAPEAVPAPAAPAPAAPAAVPAEQPAPLAKNIP